MMKFRLSTASERTNRTEKGKQSEQFPRMDMLPRDWGMIGSRWLCYQTQRPDAHCSKISTQSQTLV